MKRLTITLSWLIMIVTASAQQSLLDSLLQLIDQQNPLLQSQVFAIQSENAKAEVSAKLPDPQLGTRWFILPIYTRNGPQQFGVTLQQLFPWFGTLKHQYESGLMQRNATIAQRQELRLRLHLQAKILFANLYLLHWQRHFVQEHLEILNTIRDLLLTRIQVGRETSGNLFRLDNEIALLQQKLRSLERQRQWTIAQLFALLATEPDTSLQIAQLSIPTTMADVDTLIQLTERHNPRLQQLDFASRAAQFAAQAAEAKGYPSVGIGVDYLTITAEGINNNEMAGQDVLSIGLRFSLPLDRYRYTQLVQQHRLRHEQLRWQRRDVLYQLQSQLRTLVLEFKDLRDQLTIVTHTLIPNTQRALEILLEQYSTGRVDIEILLNTQRELLRYHEKEKALETQLFIQVARKDYLTGQLP